MGFGLKRAFCDDIQDKYGPTSRSFSTISSALPTSSNGYTGCQGQGSNRTPRRFSLLQIIVQEGCWDRPSQAERITISMSFRKATALTGKWTELRPACPSQATCDDKMCWGTHPLTKLQEAIIVVQWQKCDTLTPPLLTCISRASTPRQPFIRR